MQMPTNRVITYLRAWVDALADLDPRSLACFRIGLGVVLIYDVGLAWDVIDLWPGMQAYFDGLPLPHWAQPAGDVATLKLLFGLYAVLALGLVLGYQTRFCALALLLATGIHRCVSQTVDYHDDVLFHALFWAQFMDLGQYFSFDGRGVTRTDRWSRVGTFGLVFNVAYIYISTVVEKSDPAWWPDGTAVYYALSDVALSGVLGRWAVAHLPLFVFKMLSYQALLMELLGGLLILSPWARARCTGWILLSLLQVGLWACMRLESFPATMFTVQAALVPALLWARLGVAGRTSVVVSRPHWQRNLLLSLLVGTVLLNAEGRRLARLIDAEEPLPYRGASSIYQLRKIFHLQARWAMYAPSPPDYVGWWVCVGRTRSGAEIDPITGIVPTFKPPNNAGWPFGGLGSVYWFYEPDEEGYVQEEYTDFIRWRDKRYTPQNEQLTHFLLFYVYVPYEPVAEGPHEPMPMLVTRWPEEDAEARPVLRPDSVLREVELYETVYDKWGEMLSKRIVVPITY